MLRLGVPLVVLCSSLMISCAGTGSNVASGLAKPPELPGEKCSVKSAVSSPLIVEWPSASRGDLELRMKKGLVPVHYSGCEMKVLSRCQAQVRYAYSAFEPKRDHVFIRNEDDLYANVPMGAAKLQSTLQSAGQLDVEMTLVGKYEGERDSIRADELQGDCAEATHIITGLTVGAFEFSAGGEASLGGGAEVMGAGAGARSASKRHTLNQDGDQNACTRATRDDKAPPGGCGALLRLEVAPITRAPAAATPAPTYEAVAVKAPATPPASLAPKPASSDMDGDGIPDDKDKCPKDPEDKDGFEDEDGCPDPDNDRDGIVDFSDKCPDQPETRNGYEDEDGCPDLMAPPPKKSH